MKLGQMTSPAGVALIKRHEGLRLQAYRDVAGVWTIGWGHTGDDVRPGLQITPEHAEALLAQDIAEAERAIARFLPASVLAHLRQPAVDALVSMVFNLGAQAFADPKTGRPTGLCRALTQHRWNDIPREMRRWVYARGKVWPGLVRRREEEATMWASAWPVRDVAQSNVVPVEAPVRPIPATKTGLGAITSATGGLAAVATLADHQETAQQITSAAGSASVLAQPGTWLAVVLALLIIGGTLWTLYGRTHVRRRTGA